MVNPLGSLHQRMVNIIANGNHSLDWTIQIGKAGGDGDTFYSTSLSSVVHDRYPPTARDVLLMHNGGATKSGEGHSDSILKVQHSAGLDESDMHLEAKVMQV